MSEDTRRFLLAMLDNSKFPPKLASFVSKVKTELREAKA